MERRKQILRSASRLLKIRGYAGFSYRDIATEIGITTASMHHHFASKEALAIALCDGIEAAWEAALRAATVEGAKGRPLDILKLCLRHMIERIAGDEICPLSAFLSDYSAMPQAVQDRLARMARREHRIVEQLVSAAIDAEQLASEPDAAVQAAQILAGIKGALLYRGMLPLEAKINGRARRDSNIRDPYEAVLLLLTR